MQLVDSEDERYRAAAFQHLQAMIADGTTITRGEMSIPFFVGEERCTLVDPQRGIHKPRHMKYLLSITTVVAARGRRIWYADQTSAHRDIYSGEGEASYSFTGSDPSVPQNQWLKEAAEHRIPVIYFLGIKPGLYAPIFPAFLTDWNPRSLNVRMVFSPILGSSVTARFPTDALERRYAMRLVKQRLHQCRFREAVIDAYAGRCAISRLPEPRLLDAAHIIRDADEESGHPIISNGIPLSKIHHAAFDANLLGIDADGVVHVSDRLLDIHDGPFLEHGIKAIAGKPILIPARSEDRPDRERLDRRFHAFRRAM